MREKKRTVQHPCYNIQPWLTSETFVLPSCICLTAIHHRSLVMEILDICNGHWRIIWTCTYIHWWWCLSEAEFLKIETVTDLCPELSHGCSRVPDIRHCSRTQTLFQNSDTVPDSLMPDIGPRCLAYYCYYYSVLCRKSVARHSILHSQ